MADGPFWSPPECGQPRVCYVTTAEDRAVPNALGSAQEDITVVQARSTAEVCDRIRTESIDCVVSEHHPPEVDAVSLTERVGAVERPPPVVVYPADGDESLATRVLAAGADDYVPQGGPDGGQEVLRDRVVDVLESTQACRRHRWREQTLEELVAQSDDILWMVSADWDDVYLMNEAFEELWGVSTAALDAGESSVLDAVHPADRERASEAMEQLSAGSPIDIELRVNPQESYERWVWVKGHPVTDGTCVERIVGFSRDISDRKARERELHGQKEKITALHRVGTTIENCETASRVHEKIVTAAEEILEFDVAIVNEVQEDCLVPQAVSSHLDSDKYYGRIPVDTEQSDAAMAYRTGEAIVVDDIRTRDVRPADTAFVSSLTVPFGDEFVFQSVSQESGAFDEASLELVELLCTQAQARLNRIETEQRLRQQAAELEQQNERLEEFASVVSHDLRNPLNVATGRLELARRDNDSDHLAEVANAHDRMEELIDNLLTLAQEARQLSEIETVSLAETVERCWRTVETAAATLDVETALSVRADRTRLRQLLENLIRNSVEHGDEQVTVTVGTLPDQSGFYLADDGPGIPASEREDVFEPGYSTATDGTGFGLAIANRVAQAHGWDLSVTDGADGGARFEITGVETD
ncbi:receiver/sensor box histidine kinase [Haloarcula halophila]|uniref:receiver/sensor box histidine kinase n=1 Tax=Haloarcula TaxID=2237 RepID=UPI0023E36013|nr:ATP-binding protein [Halomicroarcula sp. DFY41]